MLQSSRRAANWRTARRHDPAFDAGTWTRLISRILAEEEIWYLSPEDQLLGEPEQRLEISRQLKLQVRDSPLHFVLEFLGQSRRLADVL
jgi:hypothetical protein